MNIKRFLGGLLTVLGIGSLIFTAILFFNSGGGPRMVREMIIFGVLGLIFFVSGINLVQKLKDE